MHLTCSQVRCICVYNAVMTRFTKASATLGKTIALAAFLLAEMLCPRQAEAKPSPAPRQGLPLAFYRPAPVSLDDLKAMERHVQDLISRVSPASVAVRVGSSAGSGVVVSEDGLVLCAAHVCDAPGREVRFTFPDGRTARGETLGTNHEIDSGLMKITEPGPWPHVDVGDPKDAHVGDWVLALGHPGGFEADRPVVARLGRLISLAGALQSDCTLISGDSGGPLFDMHGRAIGVHSRISAATSDNFHVPIETYLNTWDRLVGGENWGGRSLARSTIGVRAVDSPEGCRVDWVSQGGPASRAGLAPGDVILRVNDEKIADADSLVRFIRQISPGKEARVTVKRDGTEMAVKVMVEARRGRGGNWRPGP